MNQLIQMPVLFVKKMFNLFGVDIVRVAKNPLSSFLGLRNLPVKTVLDVGANRGQFAKKVLNVFPDARVYSFEPLAVAFNQLNALAMKEPRISAYQLALGEADAILEMFEHSEHSPSSSFLKTTEVCEGTWPCTQKQVRVPVKLTTLDNWAKSLPTQLSQDVLIKLDVQGYEDRVIKGGLETFNMAKACILEVSLDQLYEGQANFRQLSSSLYGLGYRYAGNLEQSYANDGHVMFIDAIFVK